MAYFTQPATELRKSLLRELDSITTALVLEDPFGGSSSLKEIERFKLLLKTLGNLLSVAEDLVIASSTSTPGYESRDIDSSEKQKVKSISFRLSQLAALYNDMEA